MNDEDFNSDAVFERLSTGLEHGRCLITVATGDLTDEQGERTGLVPTHAYAVLNMKEVDVRNYLKYFCFFFIFEFNKENSFAFIINLNNFSKGVKLLQLKNPWSHLRWKGNYSELDVVHWTPQLQHTLNYDPKMAEKVDNGIFWIDFNSIMNFFDVFYLNWNPALFQYTYCIHQ